MGPKDQRPAFTINGIDANAPLPPAPPPAPTVPGEDQRPTLAHKLIEGVGAQFGQHRKNVEDAAYDPRAGRWKREAGDVRADVEGFASKPEVQAQLEKAVELVADWRDEKRAKVDEIRNGLIPERDTAAEIKAQRDWSRAEKLLDSAGSDSERAMMARRMLEQTNNPAEFATLT